MKKTISTIAVIFAGLLAIAAMSINQIYAQQPPAEIQTQTQTQTQLQAQAPADAISPSDVSNLRATPGDSEVLLVWDVASDNTAVTGYKIYRGTHSVQTSEDNYDLPVIPVGAVTSYTVKNLTNGAAYYFSITAVDAAGNESANYALEASVAPQTGFNAQNVQDDGATPQVKKVISEDAITVQVVFSEQVALPQDHPESAFTIIKTLDKSALQIQNAEIDKRDGTGATVLLTTAPQEAGAEYVITAGIEIKDLAGNPVISGTSDTGAFKGSEVVRQQITASAAASADSSSAASASGDTSAPVVTGGIADLEDRISITFNEPVKLPENPKSKFSIVSAQDVSAVLEILNVSLSVDGMTLYITTAEQAPVIYIVNLEGITDAKGNVLAGEAALVEVGGRGASVEDLTPPEDVTDFIASVKNAETGAIALEWKASKNSAGDLADQMLYHGEGKDAEKFSAASSLGADATAAEVADLAGGKWYTFKVTAKDEIGNESSGAIAAIFLPETGPGMIAAGLTALIMGAYSRKKKK